MTHRVEPTDDEAVDSADGVTTDGVATAFDVAKATGVSTATAVSRGALRAFAALGGGVAVCARHTGSAGSL